MSKLLSLILITSINILSTSLKLRIYIANRDKIDDGDKIIYLYIFFASKKPTKANFFTSITKNIFHFSQNVFIQKLIL